MSYKNEKKTEHALLNVWVYELRLASWIFTQCGNRENYVFKCFFFLFSRKASSHFDRNRNRSIASISIWKLCSNALRVMMFCFVVVVVIVFRFAFVKLVLEFAHSHMNSSVSFSFRGDFHHSNQLFGRYFIFLLLIKSIVRVASNYFLDLLGHFTDIRNLYAYIILCFFSFISSFVKTDDIGFKKIIVPDALLCSII